MNTIAILKTMNLQYDDGRPVSQIVIGLNIREPQTAEAFIQEVAEKFKLQRMCSPPDTTLMLVTVVSEMPVLRFVERWRQLAAADQILNFFMSQMEKADVLRGVVAGETLETASLIHAPST